MNTADRQLTADAMDLLTQIETMLRCASIDEQIAIETAAEAIYGPNEGDHHTRLITEITTIRDRLYDHLDRPAH